MKIPNDFLPETSCFFTHKLKSNSMLFVCVMPVKSILSTLCLCTSLLTEIPALLSKIYTEKLKQMFGSTSFKILQYKLLFFLSINKFFPRPTNVVLELLSCGANDNACVAIHQFSNLDLQLCGSVKKKNGLPDRNVKLTYDHRLVFETYYPVISSSQNGE